MFLVGFCVHVVDVVASGILLNQRALAVHIGVVLSTNVLLSWHDFNMRFDVFLCVFVQVLEYLVFQNSVVVRDLVEAPLHQLAEDVRPYMLHMILR